MRIMGLDVTWIHTEVSSKGPRTQAPHQIREDAQQAGSEALLRAPRLHALKMGLPSDRINPPTFLVTLRLIHQRTHPFSEPLFSPLT